MKKHTQLVLIISPILLSLSVSACKFFASEQNADTKALAHQEGHKFRLLLPLFQKEQPAQSCFYQASWEKNQGKVSAQKAERVNRYSVSLSDLVEAPNAVAGFGATGGLVTAVTVTTFCLGTTAGIGSPLCFAAGGAIVASSIGGVAAATINNNTWEKTFSNRKPEWVSNKAIDDHLPTLIRKGENGAIECPKWDEFTTEARATAWKEAFKIAAQ